MGWRASTALVGALVLAAACAEDDDFECTEDSECVNNGIAGMCQSNNYCSFPDPGCDSSQRYAAHAPSGFAEECVSPAVAGDSTGSDAPQDDSGESDSSAGEQESCIDVELGSELGDVDSRTFAEEDDDLSPSCAHDRGNDVVYGFTAPTTGLYRFSATGGFSTGVIVTLKESCEGSELVCAKDPFDPFNSSTDWDLDEGERIVVVVEADVGHGGQFQLQIILLP